MKNVRLNLVALLAVLVFFTACKKEEFDFDNKYEDTEWVDEAGAFDDGFDQSNDTDFGDDTGETSGDGTLTTYKIDGDNITKIKDYTVSNNLLSFQQDKQKHQEMFSYYTRLIPAKYRTKITEFVVFHGGGELGGYVAPIDENDLSQWKMGLAIDLSGDLNNIDVQEEFAYVTIHEFGHVLTLSDEQVAVGDDGNCTTFHTGEGCSFRESYINELYKLGWKDIYPEFQNIETQEESEAFYTKYQDRFVTDYAATNPGEDVAEVFAVFVTQDEQPTGASIADQKVRLMYNYPELVDLRNSIRKDPVLRAMQPGSWKKIGCKHKHGKKHQHVGHSH